MTINGDVEQYCLDTGLAGFDLPDPVAMAVALDDSIITESTEEWLVVGLDGPTRGCTIPDRRFRRPGPNIRVRLVDRRGGVQAAAVRRLSRLTAGRGQPGGSTTTTSTQQADSVRARSGVRAIRCGCA